jgi:hypothetical protein
MMLQTPSNWLDHAKLLTFHKNGIFLIGLFFLKNIKIEKGNSYKLILCVFFCRPEDAQRMPNCRSFNCSFNMALLCRFWDKGEQLIVLLLYIYIMKRPSYVFHQSLNWKDFICNRKQSPVARIMFFLFCRTVIRGQSI